MGQLRGRGRRGGHAVMVPRTQRFGTRATVGRYQ
jgi:hypothetical protein